METAFPRVPLEMTRGWRKTENGESPRGNFGIFPSRSQLKRRYYQLRGSSRTFDAALDHTPPAPAPALAPPSLIHHRQLM